MIKRLGRFASIVVLCLGLSVTAAQAAVIVGPPAVGFEFEFGNLAAVRFNNTPAVNTNVTRWPDISERGADNAFRFARTTGNLENAPAWPFFRITSDNVKTVSRQIGLFTDYTRSNTVFATKLENGISSGNLEIVTGPTLFVGTDRVDTVALIRLFITLHRDSCRDSGIPGTEYISLNHLIERFNGQIHTLITDEARQQAFRLEPENGDNTFISCPIQGNAAVPQLQATMGVPLETLSGGLSASSISGWSWTDQPSIAALTELTLSESEANQLKGLIDVWTALARCSTLEYVHRETNPEDPEFAAGRLEVLCNKASLSPLPHVNLCRLASAYWGQIGASKTNAVRGKIEPLLKSRLKSVIDGASPGFYTDYIDKLGTFKHQFQKEDRATRIFIDSLLRPDETCNDNWRGPGMEYSDATIVPPLRLTRANNAPQQLGFALEFRGSGVQSVLYEQLDFTQITEFAERYFGLENGALP